MNVKSLSRVWLFATPWAVACTRLLRPWDFLGKSTGVGCHFLLQGIFPTQGSNPGLPHCRQTLYHLSHQGSPKDLEEGNKGVRFNPSAVDSHGSGVRRENSFMENNNSASPECPSSLPVSLLPSLNTSVFFFRPVLFSAHTKNVVRISWFYSPKDHEQAWG